MVRVLVTVNRPQSYEGSRNTEWKRQSRAIEHRSLNALQSEERAERASEIALERLGRSM